jgi:signal transduction histidine kinase
MSSSPVEWKNVHVASNAADLRQQRSVPTIFTRAPEERVVLGVCAGAARRWHTDPYVVRLALLYLVGWLLSANPDRDADPGADSGDAAPPALVSARSLAVGTATLALCLVARLLRVWPGDAVMIAALVVAAGSGLIWFQGQQRTTASGPADPLTQLLNPDTSIIRSVGGALLALSGVVALLARGVSVQQLPTALAALATAIAGASVIGGPYLGRLTTELRDQERARIRIEERADMAAQLHDSVLQTLALMQRSADDPRRMVMLARRQERDLRTWLYGTTSRRTAQAGSLSSALEAIGTEVEFDHGQPVETVVVGDAPLDARTEALLGAVREALVNAAKHADAERITVYVEVQPKEITAFVRDTGTGFDPAIVSAGHGIEMSIRERLGRVGGTATLESSASGTEWELVTPR